MQQEFLGEFSNSTRAENLSKEELIQKTVILETELTFALKEIYRLKNQNLTDEQIKMVLAENLGELQHALYGASSERYKKPERKKESPEPPKPRVKKPSERYPNIPIREQVITMNPAPSCDVCGKTMSDSGMTEDSEQLTVIPKRHEIVRLKRVKYRCSCQSCLTTAPSPARLIPGSSYSDEMILDVVLSKYCDLIPIERYVAMAARGGLMDLPPQSLIELTHAFADFVLPVYELIKAGVMKARVVHADETKHRMLEGSERKSWYLWGFSIPGFCFLESHDTRSGDVASDMLNNSKCEVLVSDVFSGYNKAIRVSNVIRKDNGKTLIQNANCNAHSRRYFFKAWRPHNKDPEFYLDHYHEIYQLEELTKGKPPGQILALRKQMKVRFEAMKAKAQEDFHKYPKDTKMFKATRYFIENYEGLTLFLKDPEVPIDNNLQERLLRNHVVGRKTWYGTHSERGAKTAAILFSIIETCKLNQVNPKQYLENLVKDLLAGKSPYTPKNFKDFQLS